MNEFTRNHAVVVGIDSYDHGIAPLSTATADARAVAEVLRRDHAYASPHLLLDAGATRERLRDLFDVRLRREVGPDDRLVVYFAGHGLALDECGEGPRGYLLPQDARGDDEGGWLSMSWLHRALGRLDCRHLLVILDCCFAGSFRWAAVTRNFLPPGRLYDSQYDRFVTGTAWQVLTSAAHNEKALDVAGLRNHRDKAAGRAEADDAEEAHSPFAEALIRGLTGNADSARGGFDPDGVITATELYQYVTEELMNRRGVAVEQTPGLWPLKPENSGEFVFLVPGVERDTRPDPPLEESSNPWPGLCPYTEAEADVFFGRSPVVRELEERLYEDAPPPVVVLVGASGTGKSSLVRAGLVPRLLRADPPWTVAVVDQVGDDPLRRLEEAMATLARTPQGHRSLLVVDQLEELFTQCHDSAARESFLDTLAGLIGHGEGQPRVDVTRVVVTRVVVTLRSEFEPLAAESRFGGLLAAARFVVPPFSRDELRQAVERPARVKAVYFDPPGLTGKLLDEVATVPGPLPLLSFALSEMYRQAILRRRRTGELDRALRKVDFEAAGGVVGALHRRATELYEAAPDATRRTIRRLFLRMVSTEGGQLARRRVARRELDFAGRTEQARIRQVLDEFTQARLLVAQEDYVEPAHDTLVLGWPKLNAWRTEHAESLELMRSAWWSALDWEANGGDRDLLWDRDPRLPQLEALWSELNRLEQSFVRASRRRRQWKKRAGAGAVVAAGAVLGAVTHRALKRARRARSLLDAAQDAADEVALTVEHDLSSIAGTAEVRRKLLDTAAELRERLRDGGRHVDTARRAE